MYLLDTNVISEFRKIRTGRAHANVIAWSKSVELEQMYLSVMTLEELEIGCLLAATRDPEKGLVLRNWIDKQLHSTFSNRILPVTLSIVQISAPMHIPKTRSVRDALIAATAVAHGCTVVTRNTAHFQVPGLTVLNPWLPSSSANPSP